MAAPPTPSRGGMSLYANLLAPKAAGGSAASISRAPVAFTQADGARDDAATKKPVDPALRFQPIRRPQAKQAKGKTGFPKAPPGGIAAAAPPAATATGTPAQQPKNTLADWAATEGDEYLYGTGEKRQRGGRKKKKKKFGNEPVETNWDELYDPARPTNVDEYLRSDERINEIRDWKAVLYAHRRRRKPSYDSDMASDEEEDRRPALPNQFAPPASYSFAPPPVSPPREAASTIPDDATGDDAYARRLALSGVAPPPPAPPTSLQPPSQPPPPPPPATISGATISRAPVRYEPPPPPPPEPAAPDAMAIDSDAEPDRVAPPGEGEDDDDSAAPRAKRPGQAGFAERLMSKYGWTRGAGLGAESTGITSALRVQVEKRRRRPDAEGGGFAEPGGRGRIIGGKGSKKKATGETGDADGGFGPMSEVVVLRGMLEGMPNLVAEMEAGLAQEIGEECGEKYGRVERLFIDVEDRQVFIKFTDQVSALRAVNALEGRIFNGNTIMPRFYDTDKFEQGVYK